MVFYCLQMQDYGSRLHWEPASFPWIPNLIFWGVMTAKAIAIGKALQYAISNG